MKIGKSISGEFLSSLKLYYRVMGHISEEVEERIKITTLNINELIYKTIWLEIVSYIYENR